MWCLSFNNSQEITEKSLAGKVHLETRGTLGEGFGKSKKSPSCLQNSSYSSLIAVAADNTKWGKRRRKAFAG